MVHQHDSILWFKINGLSRYLLAHLVTQAFPLYVVNEYPKSGGSWIGDMLSDAIGVPFPRNRLPMLKSSILHGHMMHSWNMHNVLLVWRDGRDILVSQYYHSLFENNRGNAFAVRKARADLNFKDYDDIKANLPKFMEYVYETKKHPAFSWKDFANKWACSNSCVHVKYEMMRTKPVDELLRIVRELTGKNAPKESIQEIVDSYSFERMSGRKPGEESKKSFLRKGVVGDWKNHFNFDARERFQYYAGDVLIRLGYENDDSWIYDK